MLHDVNLTAARPAAIGALCGHHPMRCPSSSGGAYQAGAAVELPVEPVLPRLQLGGREPVTSIVLEAGADLQGAVADPGVVSPVGVELVLIVAEATARMNRVPHGRIHRPVVVEFLLPHLRVAIVLKHRSR